MSYIGRAWNRES